MVKYPDISTVWSDRPRNKYDPALMTVISKLVVYCVHSNLLLLVNVLSVLFFEPKRFLMISFTLLTVHFMNRFYRNGDIVFVLIMAPGAMS